MQILYLHKLQRHLGLFYLTEYYRSHIYKIFGNSDTHYFELFPTSTFYAYQPKMKEPMKMTQKSRPLACFDSLFCLLNLVQTILDDVVLNLSTNNCNKNILFPLKFNKIPYTTYNLYLLSNSS